MRESGHSAGVLDLGDAGTADRLVREIRKARRHTRRVRALKLLLPLLSVALLLTLLVPGGAARRVGGVNVALDGARITDDGISMDNPRISGIGAKGRPFEIQARRAIQNIRNPKVVTFQELQAKFKMTDQDSATVTARTGVYDSEHETLKLVGNIHVRSSSAQEADLDSADVDLKRGSMITQDPAVLRTPTSVVQGRSLTVSESGGVVALDGGVRMTLLPAQEARR